MKIKQIGKIFGGQDGAIFGHELFRLDHLGNCDVYDLSKIKEDICAELSPTSSFRLDRAEELAPHSNAVFFGKEKYAPEDCYPLLYTNVYNNYAQSEDPMLGTCCVYRIQRKGESFVSTLVQLIEIGFCEDSALWKASEEGHGVRPYGNFLFDAETNSYYAFVMRNQALGTRYFRFDMPSVYDGEMDDRFGVRRAVLGADDIKDSFDGGYIHFMQGAALYRGCIYVTEGFSNDTVNRPAFRVVDLASQTERYTDLLALGISEEPEMIDFWNGICYYSDSHGRLYTVDFCERMRVKDKLNMDYRSFVEKGAITIVAFGDSVTFGALGFDEIDYESVYWNRLRKKLNEKRNDIPVNVINAGIGGVSAKQSLSRLERDVLIHEPDLVIVCFALNDVNGTPEDYLSSLRTIFERILRSGAEVIFLTPNMLNTRVADDTPEVYRSYAEKTARMQNEGRMDLFVGSAVALAQEMGVAVCDCYAEWKKRSETEDITLLLSNRINHPTREMHELFASRLYGMIMDENMIAAPAESTMWRGE